LRSRRACSIFFSMILRPPISTLFPYTSSSDLELEDTHLPHLLEPVGGGTHAHALEALRDVRRRIGDRPEAPREEIAVEEHLALRSEEHTSELQSRFDLVCRLLLEKKKKAQNEL